MPIFCNRTRYLNGPSKCARRSYVSAGYSSYVYAFNPTDFYEPLQVGLGEQTIFNGEIYAQGTSADLSVFAYQERFAEYRFKILKLLVFSVPMILLLFKSGIFQQFGSLPVLNASFITENMPIDRALAVATSTSPAFLADMSFDYLHVRPMPVRSNPGISRF